MAQLAYQIFTDRSARGGDKM